MAIERQMWGQGHEVVVGVDEVGRGAWAGPLSVGMAVLPRDRRVYGVRDSKMLDEAQRERLFLKICNWCVTWAVGHASHLECDELGMSAAQRLAAGRALKALGLVADVVLIDGGWDFVSPAGPPPGPFAGAPAGPPPGPAGVVTRRIVRGDATCLSIATASILAKVTRDRLMRIEAEHFPAYSFESNKGYPSPRHRMALAAWGPSAIHRRSWVFMDSLVWGGRSCRP